MSLALAASTTSPHVDLMPATREAGAAHVAGNLSTRAEVPGASAASRALFEFTVYVPLNLQHDAKQDCKSH